MTAPSEERTTIEERVSRIEGGQTHLATKADIAELRVEIAKSGARTARWMAASVSVGVAVMAVVYRVVG